MCWAASLWQAEYQEAGDIAVNKIDIAWFYMILNKKMQIVKHKKWYII